MNRLLYILIFILLSSHICSADTVYLKSGEQLQGVILEETGKQIIIRTDHELRIVYKPVASIQRDIRENIKAQASPEPAAMENEDQTEDSSGSHFKRYGLEVGYEYSAYTYKEPTIMSLSGIMQSVNMAYTFPYTGSDLSYMRAELILGSASLDYDGSTWGGAPVKIKEIPDNLTDARLILGIDYPLLGNLRSACFIGAGDRSLIDNGQRRSDGGYQRESRYIYVIYGLDMMWQIDSGSEAGFNFEYDTLSSGLQTSRLSDLDPLFDDMENRQLNGWGLRGSLKYDMLIGSNSLCLELFSRSWEIGRSEEEGIFYGGALIGFGYEPANVTYENGFKISYKW